MQSSLRFTRSTLLWKFTRVRAIILGEKFYGEGQFSGSQFSLGLKIQGRGGNHPGGNCPGAIIRGAIFLGDNCPRTAKTNIFLGCNITIAIENG